MLWKWRTLVHVALQKFGCEERNSTVAGKRHEARELGDFFLG